MSGLIPTLQEVIERGIASALRRIFTVEIGTVVAFDPAKGAADIRLANTLPVPKSDGTFAQETRPILPDVRVLFPQGAKASLSWEPQPGDGMLVVGLKMSPFSWFQRGGVVPPGDLRLFHLAHTVAIPCIARAPLPADPDHATVLQISDILKINSQDVTVAAANTFHVDCPDVRLGDTGATPAAVADKVDTDFEHIMAPLVDPANWAALDAGVPGFSVALTGALLSAWYPTAHVPPGTKPIDPTGASKVKIT